MNNNICIPLLFMELCVWNKLCYRAYYKQTFVLFLIEASSTVLDSKIILLTPEYLKIRDSYFSGLQHRHSNQLMMGKILSRERRKVAPIDEKKLLKRSQNKRNG